MDERLTNESVELLQQLIRNECVNDGTIEGTGHESRNADTLQQVIEGTGLDVQRWEPVADRASIVARIEGSDPDAPSICLMGHTDVVPVNEDGWDNDPFGGELIDGEVWGRGAVDMLNLTSSMAVAFRHLADTNFKPKGDVIFFGVADEEAGTPGHGSRPFRSDNALVTAAAVVQRLSDYRPAPKFTELWRNQVAAMNLDEATTAILLDESRLNDHLAEHPLPDVAGHLWSCTHCTFSPNMVASPTTLKANVIPDTIDITVDIRTLPGEGPEEIQAHLDTALGDLADRVEVSIDIRHPSSISRHDTPLWESMQKAVAKPFPTATLNPSLIVGFTDSRVYREMGSIAYGAGLFSPSLEPGEFGSRFHGHNERIDVESMALTTQFFIDVVKDLQG